MTELKGANRFDYEVVKLLRLMHTDDLMLQVLDMVFKALIPQMQAEDPDFPAEEYIERIQQRVDIDSLLYEMVPIYSCCYTREEVAGLIAFFETPLGRKSIKEIPQMIQEIYTGFQAWLEPLLERFFEKTDFDSMS